MRSEITRRLVHASGTALPVAYLLFEPVTWTVVQALLTVGLVVALVLEVVRLVVGLDWWVYERLTREYERDNLAGYFLAIVGLTVVAFAFPPEGGVTFPPTPQVGVAAMLMLTISDPVSGLLSSGELRGAKRTYVLLATFAVSVLLASPFVPPLAAVVGGLATTVADGIKPVIRGYVIDDNITIPIAAGTAMYVAVEYLPTLGL